MADPNVPFIHSYYYYLCSLLAMKYHVLVVAEGKYFGLNTACLYVNLSGEFRETGVKEIPRGECQIEFEVGAYLALDPAPLWEKRGPGINCMHMRLSLH